MPPIVVHRGGCICGKLSYAVSGDPMLSAYCHCTLCQRLNCEPRLAKVMPVRLRTPTAAAFIHTIHFSSSAFAWTCSDIEHIADTFEVTSRPWKKRFCCKSCGCCVASYNSQKDKYSVWGAQLDRDENGRILDWDHLKPTAHIFYGSRMIDVNDNLGKWEGYEASSTRIS